MYSKSKGWMEVASWLFYVVIDNDDYNNMYKYNMLLKPKKNIKFTYLKFDCRKNSINTS